MATLISVNRCSASPTASTPPDSPMTHPANSSSETRSTSMLASDGRGLASPPLTVGPSRGGPAESVLGGRPRQRFPLLPLLGFFAGFFACLPWTFVEGRVGSAAVASVDGAWVSTGGVPDAAGRACEWAAMEAEGVG